MAVHRVKGLPVGLERLARLMLLDAAENVIANLTPAHFRVSSVCSAQTSRRSARGASRQPGLLHAAAGAERVRQPPSTLPRELAGAVNLRHLDLHLNALGADGVAMLPPSFGELRSVARLDASYNLASRLHPCLALCPSLRHLNLSHERLPALTFDLASLLAIETRPVLQLDCQRAPRFWRLHQLARAGPVCHCAARAARSAGQRLGPAPPAPL